MRLKCHSVWQRSWALAHATGSHPSLPLAGVFGNQQVSVPPFPHLLKWVLNWVAVRIHLINARDARWVEKLSKFSGLLLLLIRLILEQWTCSNSSPEISSLPLHFLWSLRPSSVMERDTVCALPCEEGGAQKSRARGAEPDSVPDLLIRRPFTSLLRAKRNEKARGQDYLGRKSSWQKLEMFERSTLSFFTLTAANLGN